MLTSHESCDSLAPDMRMPNKAFKPFLRLNIEVWTKDILPGSVTVLVWMENYSSLLDLTD